MKVYRVEHPKTNTGPYHYLGPMWGEKDHLYDCDHPCPDDEGLEMYREDVCGFESKEKLLKWFTLEDLKDFKDCGLKVYKMCVPKGCIEYGHHQVVFTRKEVYSKKEISLQSLRALH